MARGDVKLLREASQQMREQGEQLSECDCCHQSFTAQEMDSVRGVHHGRVRQVCLGCCQDSAELEGVYDDVIC